VRQLVAATRRFAEPERNVRGRALGVLDADATRLDLQDAVARVAELEDVAAQALDREVLVDRADRRRLRLEQHRVVAGLGDGSARRQRRHPRTALLAELVMHGVAVDMRAPAGARRETVGEHAHDVIERRAL